VTRVTPAKRRFLKRSTKMGEDQEQQWFRERGPSRDECERILREMLEHPEDLLDAEDVIRELEKEWKDSQNGDHLA
jgi:hypothetical protein